MTDRDQIKMEINIADELLQLTVPFSDQEEVRDTERRLNDLYSSWRIRFPRKHPKELLAMIAYQYASHFYALRKKYDLAANAAGRTEELLDRLLSD